MADRLKAKMTVSTLLGLLPELGQLNRRVVAALGGRHLSPATAA
jgi:hypothetical protein